MITSSQLVTDLSIRVCKTVECMVNHQLFGILESRNLISNALYGFQCHRSNLDHLMYLEDSIKNFVAIH